MGKIEIKIEGRWANLPMTDKDEWVYDIYHNVSFFRPLLKKWVIDKMALTREEALDYIGKFALDSNRIAIINC